MTAKRIGVAVIGVGGVSLGNHLPGLALIPGVEIVALCDRSEEALAKVKPLTLEVIAKHPIVTYDPTFAGRTSIDRTFSTRGLHPEFALTALDSDVIKSYVSLGLGVGIVAEMATHNAKQEGLEVLDASHLFPAQTTRIAFRKGAYLRGYTVEFIRLFAPNVRGEDLKHLEGAAGENFSI